MHTINHVEEFTFYDEDSCVPVYKAFDTDEEVYSVYRDEDDPNVEHIAEVHPSHVSVYSKMYREISTAMCVDCLSNPCCCGLTTCVIGNLYVSDYVAAENTPFDYPSGMIVPFTIALPLYCGGMVMPCKVDRVLASKVYESLKVAGVDVSDKVNIMRKLLYFCTFGSDSAVPLMRGTKVTSESTACFIRFGGAWIVGVENAENVVDPEIVREGTKWFNGNEMTILLTHLEAYDSAKKVGFSKYWDLVASEGIEYPVHVHALELDTLPFSLGTDAEYRFRDPSICSKEISTEYGVVRRNLQPFAQKPKSFEILSSLFPYDIRVALCTSQCQKLSAKGEALFFCLGALEDPTTVGFDLPDGATADFSVFRPILIKAAKGERFELVVACSGGTGPIEIRCEETKIPHYYPVTWYPVDSKGAAIYRCEFGSVIAGTYSVTWCGRVQYFEIAGRNNMRPYRNKMFLPIVGFVSQSALPFCTRPRDAPYSVGVFEPKTKPGTLLRRLASVYDRVDEAYESLSIDSRSGSSVLYECSGMIYLGMAPYDPARVVDDVLDICRAEDYVVCYKKTVDPYLLGHQYIALSAEVLCNFISCAMESGELQVDPKNFISPNPWREHDN